MIVPLFFTKEMNILLQGEKRALELGVDVERTKAVLVVTAAILTAIAVSVSGIIAFVGLIIPHLVRLLVGPSHRRLLPLSMLLGAALLSMADLAGAHPGGAHGAPGRRSDHLHRGAGVRVPAAPGQAGMTMGAGAADMTSGAGGAGMTSGAGGAIRAGAAGAAAR